MICYYQYVTTLPRNEYCRIDGIMILRMLNLLPVFILLPPLLPLLLSTFSNFLAFSSPSSSTQSPTSLIFNSLPLIPLHNNTEIQSLSYEKLCICSGAQPKVIAPHPNILGLRDLQSVTDMAVRLSSARKVIIVGNGGIALELVHSVLHH